MKNFPHQFVDFYRYRGALNVAKTLLRKRKGFQDDTTYGYALAKSGVYGFSTRKMQKRGPLPRNLTMSGRIALEKTKAASDQGAETCGFAEVRAVLRYLGFSDQGRLTSRGNKVAGLKPAYPTYMRIWQEAVLGIAMRDDVLGTVSHPARLMLRMIAERKALDRRALALALDARDDSNSELQRILALVPRSAQEVAKLRRQFGPTTYDNAMKIVPAFCERSGLIQRPTRSYPYTLTESGWRALESMSNLATSTSRRTLSLPSGRIASYVVYDPRKRTVHKQTALKNFQSREQQEEANRIRRERTTRHEEARRFFARALSCKRFEFVESSVAYDLLAYRAQGRPLLVEVKSLERDYLERTRSAIGQLYYYRDVKLQLDWKRRNPHLVVVFDRELPSYLLLFLDHLKIAAFLAFKSIEPLNRKARVLWASL